MQGGGLYEPSMGLNCFWAGLSVGWRRPLPLKGEDALYEEYN